MIKSGGRPAPAGLRQVLDRAGLGCHERSLPSGGFQPHFTSEPAVSPRLALGWGSALPPSELHSTWTAPQLLPSSIHRLCRCSSVARRGSSSPERASSYLADESIVLAQPWLQVLGAGRVTAGQCCTAQRLLGHGSCSAAAPLLPRPAANHPPKQAPTSLPQPRLLSFYPPAK